MTTVLGIDLGETEDLRVCQWTTVLLLQSVQVFNLLRTQGQTFLLIVFLQVVYILDGLRLDVNRKDVLVEAIIHTL